MNALYIKAIHIVLVVSWFAGLFYIVRLFIYHAEAEDKPSQEKEILQKQFIIMERLLLNVITTPAMIGTLLTGLYLAYSYRMFSQGWLHVKLLLIVGLVAYHFSCIYIFKRFLKGDIRYTSTQLRMWNEVATIFLVGIVFVVVLKSTLSVVWGVGGLILFGTVMMIIVKLYKRARAKRAKSS